MKTPSIPKPKPAVEATAPVLNTAGTAKVAQQQRQKYGFMSTFMGANAGGNAQRLSQYLGGTTSGSSKTSFGRSKVTPGGVTHR